MKFLCLVLGLIIMTLILGCNKSEENNLEKVSINNRENTDLIGFITYKYIDPMIGIEAFQLLIPKGWKVNGGITWSSNPALPAQSHFCFYNPNGNEQVEFFPTQSYFWTDNQTALYTNPPGSLRFGTLVAQPISLQSAFRNIILPTFRDRIHNLKIEKQIKVNELEQLAIGQPTEGVNSYADGGKIRFTYLENNIQMEEEMFGVVSQFITNLPGSYFSPGYFINYWYIDYIFSFKAEKSRLDKNSKIYQTMILSFKLNPKWFAKVVNTKERMVQMIIQGIKEIGKISTIISNSSSELRNDQLEDWERRQEANDRIVQNFSDNIRSVERYNDPYSGNEVELPAGYGNVWANNLGEYIITESTSFNPNENSNLHWLPLEQVK